MAIRENHTFTILGWTACAWILVTSFQYGYHISALNQIQAIVTCKTHSVGDSYYGLPTCIAMSDATFSAVTSVFPAGGLLGSGIAGIIMDKYGRRGALRISAASTAFGSFLMGIAPFLAPLLIGRFLTGLGSGVGLCVGPVFIAEISPPTIKGKVGVLTQLGIVLGIMLTQSLGFKFATPTQWRFVLLFSAVLGTVQFLTSPIMVESPAWSTRHGNPQNAKNTLAKLWKSLPTDPKDDVEDPLLDDQEPEPSRAAEDRDVTVGISQLLKSPDLRRPLFIVTSVMLCQQISGINAVLYYSNDILSKALPDLGPYISLLITVVNAAMTFPPIFLIERVGRKKLLSTSSYGAIASLILVGFGLNHSLVALSSVAILAFIASFAIGLGPVPFIIIPDVSPAHAVSALSSVALSMNWIVNFIVGIVFLPLRNLLASGDGSQEGRVFYVFAVVFFACFHMFSRVYRS